MHDKKLAVVLSGGGSRGAIEAGALLSLAEHGIQPNMLVGTSIGALNAAAMALDPTLKGAQRIVEDWQEVHKWNIFPTNYMVMLLNLITGKDSLLGNRKLARYVSDRVLRGARCFADIRPVELYIIAESLDTGLLHVFGKDQNEPLLDAVMSSTALVPFLPPWEYEGLQYIDAFLVREMPIKTAIEGGATEIYAIDIGIHKKPNGPAKGFLRIIEKTVAAVSYSHIIYDLDWAKRIAPASFHYINISDFEHVRLWDFSHSKEMITMGKQKMDEYLNINAVPLSH